MAKIQENWVHVRTDKMPEELDGWDRVEVNYQSPQYYSQEPTPHSLFGQSHAKDINWSRVLKYRVLAVAL